MSKQSNTVMIGGFVAGAFLILFALLFYLSGNVFNRDSDTALLVFDGSVKGLKIGAPVAFKGVEVGEVIDFDVIVNVDTYEVLTPVGVRIYSDKIVRFSGGKRAPSVNDDTESALIERGLRAQLQLQSLLTGLLFIQLDFHPGSTPRFTAEDLERYEIPDDITVIPTIPSDFERLSRGLQEINFRSLADNLQATLKGIDSFITDEDFQALPKDISATLAAIEKLSLQLDTEVQAISPGLNALIAETSETMQTLNSDLPDLSENTREALVKLTETLEAARETLNNVDYLLSDDSPTMYELTRAAAEMAAAGRALQSLAETLETQPEALLRGKSRAGN